MLAFSDAHLDIAWSSLSNGRDFVAGHPDAALGLPDLLEASGAPTVAVLATCASARRTGHELWGSLGAGLLLAGSRSVIATANPVRDGDAHRFVREYYRSGLPDDPVAALAATQRTLLAAGSPPEAWASFVALGVASEPR